MSLDNAGVWNLRVENLDRWYLGQETYIRIINPEENGKTEMGQPKNVLYCGALKSLQKWALDAYLSFLSYHLQIMMCENFETFFFCDFVQATSP